MGILSKYELFVEKRKIKFMCDKFALSDYTINDDLSVDVEKYVYLQSFQYDGKLLSYLPFKFGVVNGDFDVSRTDISDFTNFPNLIKGRLNIKSTKINSLIGIPVIDNLRFEIHLNLRNTDIKELDIDQNLKIDATSSKLTHIKDLIPVYFVDTPIFNLIIKLDFLFMRHVDCKNLPKKQISLNKESWIERLNEFEVIKNVDELDMISMNSLFDYYGQSFGEYEIESIKINSNRYKIIN